eukprot:1685316-Rhodomonas_salina.1
MIAQPQPRSSRGRRRRARDSIIIIMIAHCDTLPFGVSEAESRPGPRAFKFKLLQAHWHAQLSDAAAAPTRRLPRVPAARPDQLELEAPGPASASASLQLRGFKSLSF